MAGNTTSLVLGFPIRKSSDLSSVDSSPRLIAASYVLHRLLVPRHPPYALTHLLTKMLASTVQFSNNTPAPNRISQDQTEELFAVSRKIRADRIFCLERTSVLSGPNSVSIYPPRYRTEPAPWRDEACQRSTHELPRSHRRGHKRSLTQPHSTLRRTV